MSKITWLNCLLVLIGAGILVKSIIEARGLVKALGFIPDRHKERLRTHLLLHRSLMVIFVFGYLLVAICFAFEYSLFSDVVVSIIFLLGAVFVLVGTTVQSQLLAEVQQTIHGLLPICMYCKRIKISEGDSENKESWKKIETYLSQKTEANFTHGLCPECFEEEIRKFDGMVKLN